MKKVLILYTGIGNGHKSVGEAIKEELLEKGYDVEILDSAKYANPIAFGITVFMGVNMQKYFQGVFNYLYSRKVNIKKKGLYTRFFARVFNTKKFLQLIKDKKPDIVISTYFINSRQISNLKEKGIYDVPTITIDTDHDCHNWWLTDYEYMTYFIVGDENLKKQIMNKGLNNSKVLDYGIPISNKFKPVPKEKHNKIRILFFGGGGLGFERSLPYLQVLQNNPMLEIKFVSGRNEKLYKKAKKVASDNTEVIGYSNNVSELLQWADLVVSKAGGITTTECINSGVPMIAILSSGGHEGENVNYIVSNNAGIWCESPDILIREIHNLCQDRNRIIEMSNKCNRIAKMGTVKKIAKLVFEITKDNDNQGTTSTRKEISDSKKR